MQEERTAIHNTFQVIVITIILESETNVLKKFFTFFIAMFNDESIFISLEMAFEP
jgi:hypothetical protein